MESNLSNFKFDTAVEQNPERMNIENSQDNNLSQNMLINSSSIQGNIQNNILLNNNLTSISLNNQEKNYSKITNGIDFDRICGYNLFMKDVFTRITCSICTLIPYEPLECKNCNAVVCKQCVDRWKRKNAFLDAEEIHMRRLVGF